jgi:hypothetical protein
MALGTEHSGSLLTSQFHYVSRFPVTQGTLVDLPQALAGVNPVLLQIVFWGTGNLAKLNIS